MPPKPAYVTTWHGIEASPDDATLAGRSTMPQSHGIRISALMRPMLHCRCIDQISAAQAFVSNFVIA
jgi:hypothetical protein